ncbi:LOW QUALITY PROTEIN: hypothetical protein CRUP_018302, partial [Coryphaenoides rupestris]
RRTDGSTFNFGTGFDYPPASAKKKTNYFIVSLAFADLLVALVVMPFAAIELTTGQWFYGEIFCLIRTSLDVLLTTASILHLCCIALDRYYAICCQPLVYRHKMTPGGGDAGRLLAHPLLHLLPTHHATLERHRCVFLVNRPYALVCSAVAFYVPLALMVLVYQRIYVTAMGHARQIEMLQRAGSAPSMAAHTPGPTHSTAPAPSSSSSVAAASPTSPPSTPTDKFPSSSSRMRVETKAAKTLAIIMGCFCLCWAPFFITNVVDPFIQYSVPWQLWTAWLWLGYINSGLNPFLYAFLNRAFRRAFMVILCCGDQRYAHQGSYTHAYALRPCSATSANGTSIAL